MKPIPLCVCCVCCVWCVEDTRVRCVLILVRVHAWCGFLVRVNGAGAW